MTTARKGTAKRTLFLVYFLAKKLIESKVDRITTNLAMPLFGKVLILLQSRPHHLRIRVSKGGKGLHLGFFLKANG